MTGAPREAYADPDFVIVRMTAVRALGSWEAAGCFQRIAWRCERDGEWTATMQEIADEIGVSLRTAKRITARLREVGWIVSERRNVQVSTLTWSVVWAGQDDSAKVAPGGEGQVGTLGSAKVAPTPEGQTGITESADVARTVSASEALSSSKTGETSETTTPGEPGPVAVDLNADREDVDRICSHLHQRLTERQIRHNHTTKAWRDAARLMLDRDGRTEQQIHNMIEWSQRNSFWMGVIHSLPNLREKYDKMRDQALRDGRGAIDNRHTLPPEDPSRAAREAAFDGR